MPDRFKDSHAGRRTGAGSDSVLAHLQRLREKLTKAHGTSHDHNQQKPPHACSVRELLAAGSTSGAPYSEEDAIEQYMALHPDADEVEVRAELSSMSKDQGPKI